MNENLKKIWSKSNSFLIPIISILILTIILYIPRMDYYWNFLRQAPFFTGIYFWKSQRPDIFNIFSAFILGFFADVLGGILLGINIISFLILYTISAEFSIRFNIKRFSYSWLLFALAVIITLAFKAVIMSILYRHTIPLDLLSLELCLILAVYPLLTHIFIWTEHHYIHKKRRYEKIK